MKLYGRAEEIKKVLKIKKFQHNYGSTSWLNLREDFMAFIELVMLYKKMKEEI